MTTIVGTPINDSITGAPGNDIIYGLSGNDTLDGGAGNDYVSADSGNDFALGGDGDDNVSGGSGNDIVLGGAGNDTVSGGQGFDILNGGTGDDLVVAGTNDDWFTYERGDGRDTYIDWYSTPWEIVYRAGSALAPGYSWGPDQRSIYRGDQLVYDGASWKGPTDYDVETGTRQFNPGAIIGSSGYDTIGFGPGIGIDNITFQYSADDKDLVIGIGAPGADAVHFADLTDQIILKGWGGTPSAVGSIEAFAFMDSETVVDDVHLEGGTDAADAITGLVNQQNWITGGAGNDTLTGRNLADILNGNAGADVINGGAGDDQLYGGAGDDKLFGSTGFDTLFGGEGNDTLFGGADNDILDGGNGIDTASYETTTAGVTVSLALQPQYGFTGAQATGGAGFDTLAGFENLTGSAYADTLRGSIGDNVLNGGGGDDVLIGNGGRDSLVGGNGDDRLVGGADNDKLNGGAGIDTADYSAAGGVVSVNLGMAVGQNTVSAGLDTLSGIENLIGSAFGDTLTGSALANRIEGGVGADLIGGQAGNDVLIGGEGNDRLTGDAGADQLFGGAGADTFRYVALADSTVALAGQDVVLDFSHAEGDHIGLVAIDANTVAAGDQAFKLVAAFSGVAGQLISQFDAATGNYLVQGDVNGDWSADFAIQVHSATALVAADFVL